MTANGWAQIALFIAIVVVTVRPVGGYMNRVFAGERNLLSPILGPVERGLYRLSGVDPNEEQHWVTYAVAMLLFSLVGTLVLYAMLPGCRRGCRGTRRGNRTSRRTSPSIPRSALSRTPTGRTIQARRRSAISRRWPG